jgi:cyclic 2,3-diphosphoglycerate synthetase
VRTVAVIDGEHYAPVVRDALARLPHEVVACVLVGGIEKLRGGETYDVPLAVSLEAAIAEHAPDLVFDLSDEPVLGPRERMALAGRVLALGIPYEGPDFRLEPPAYEPFEVASLAVIGTGKRVGKTAVTGRLARLAAQDLDVIVVSMGRGGPPEPEVIESPPTVDELVALSRAGRHAASDHLETAALARVPTIGCWRCGGGLAGGVAISNVSDGAALAAARAPDLVIFDGSGAAIPPVAVDGRVLVANGLQDVSGGLNPYRILVSDLVVLTGGDELVRRAVVETKDVPVIRTKLRLAPAQPLAGRRTAVFTTGPAPTEHLDAEVVHVSRSLADRHRLTEELQRIAADVYLVELKAAAIDVVAEAARASGTELVLADNEVVPLPDEPDLDAELQRLVETAARQAVAT